MESWPRQRQRKEERNDGRKRQRAKGRTCGGETTNSEPLKEWTDKYYRQDRERGREMELQWSVAG